MKRGHGVIDMKKNKRGVYVAKKIQHDIDLLRVTLNELYGPGSTFVLDLSGDVAGIDRETIPLRAAAAKRAIGVHRRRTSTGRTIRSTKDKV